MFAIAARRMGYRVQTFSPYRDTPTGQVADVEIHAPYHDLDAVREFARSVSVVTFEFENVPAATAQAAAESAPVRPDGLILHTTQHRLREKTFLASNGLPVTPFRAVHRLEDLIAGLQELGCPAILKTAGFGYDGKGQIKIISPEQAVAAFDLASRQEMVLEPLVDFQCELSVIAARGLDGTVAHWGVIENSHRNHILDISIAPAAIPSKVYEQAVEISRIVVEKLNLVGLLCVEFFLSRTGELLINELAPPQLRAFHLRCLRHQPV
jgi:5-(carboxyamino)imidazole ribonucleotide synthase